jgi:nitroreductase
MEQIVPANETETALLSRRSVRGYLPTPVPRETLLHLLDVAARAPSGTNMQPWRVIALAGAALDAFRDGMCEMFTAGAAGEAIETPYYPSPLPEPFLSRRRKIGWDLYGLLGIARGEKEKMTAHALRNLRFFEAPIGLICTIDKRLLIGSWVDYGMFLQNIATAARARGLDTCAMAIFAEFPTTVRRLLDIGEGESVVCGMAIGHEDASAPANALRTERVKAEEFTEFRGF